MYLRRSWNLIKCAGWSFRLDGYELSPSVVRPGDRLTVTGGIVNDGFRLGSVYLVVLLADPYDHRRLTFSTHRDLAPSEKQTLRLVDIAPGEKRAFCAQVVIPPTFDPGVHDAQIQVWNPVRLFHYDPPILGFFHYQLFDRSPWRGAVEVVVHNVAKLAESVISGSGAGHDPRAFISYSWDSPEHQRWVLELADELVRHGVTIIVDKRDIAPGEEITEFIERGIQDSDVLILVCSDKYTEKADSRLGGVGMETVISTATFLTARQSKKFIPVVRNNPRPGSRKLPTYLGSTLYVDMDSRDWRAEPLQELLHGIRKVS